MKKWWIVVLQMGLSPFTMHQMIFFSVGFGVIRILIFPLGVYFRLIDLVLILD